MALGFELTSCCISNSTLNIGSRLKCVLKTFLVQLDRHSRCRSVELKMSKLRSGLDQEDAAESRSGGETRALCGGDVRGIPGNPCQLWEVEKVEPSCSYCQEQSQCLRYRGKLKHLFLVRAWLLLALMFTMPFTVLVFISFSCYILFKAGQVFQLIESTVRYSSLGFIN